MPQRFFHKRLLMILNFIQSAKITRRMLRVVRWEDHPPPWSHYPWSAATTDDVLAPDDVIARHDIIARTHITLDRLHGFSWNLVRTLSHRSLLQTCTFSFPTIGNTNVTDAQIRSVRVQLRYDATIHNPRRRLMTSLPVSPSISVHTNYPFCFMPVFRWTIWYHIYRKTDDGNSACSHLSVII
jgi:hypothetical protein